MYARRSNIKATEFSNSMSTVYTLQGFDVDAYAGLKHELDLMNDALQHGNIDTAKHHQFVALIMSTEIAREQEIDTPTNSENDKISLSARACIVEA